MNLNENIRTMRRHHNWTQKEASLILETNISNIGAYEEGRASPPLDVINRMIIKFGIPDHKVHTFLFDKIFPSDLDSERPGKTYIEKLEDFIFFLATHGLDKKQFQKEKAERIDQLQACKAILALNYPDFFKLRRKWTDLENIK